MNIEKFKSKLIEILKADERIWNEEKTELNETKLFDLIDKIDETIITLLLKNEETRKKFFSKINDFYVFKTSEFKFFMEEHKVNNSYTQYKSIIGLTDGKRFLKDTNDIVLNWPCKDCVLEGGQTTEEGIDTYFKYENEKAKTGKKKKVTQPAGYKEKQSKRKEIFFNEILAQDEIDRLYDDKAFVNWKRYTSKGKEKVKEIQRDENGIIKENFIIKGNNLLALHCIKTQFAGKVKLIYIDPPYNTGNDSFKYNDNFNHSAWLTFMKNRLEVAKELLSDDGVIFVQCDDFEQEYLKLILNEIFKNDNHISTIFIQVRYPDKQLATAMTFHKLIEHIFIFRKSLKGKIYQELKEYSIDKYVYEIQTEGKPNSTKTIGGKKVEIYNKNNYKIIKHDNSNGKYLKEIWASGKILDSSSTGRFFRDYLTGRKIEDGLGVLYKVYGIGSGLGYRYITGPQKENATKGKYYQEVPYEKLDENYSGDIQAIQNYYDMAPDFGNCRHEGGVELRSGKKPEKLLKKIIEISTKQGDIVLDFHLGSGTTCAVSHKMHRQYIGIEQLDYSDNDSAIRLQNVINGDKTGVSEYEDVNWQGGGSFIYCELAKWNELAKEEIQSCKNLNDLIKLFDTLYEKYFLNYNLRIKEFKDNIIHEDEFKKLSLEEHKRMFLTMLDLNQMYVHRSEMSDKRYGISKDDQALTEQFYNNGK